MWKKVDSALSPECVTLPCDAARAAGWNAAVGWMHWLQVATLNLLLDGYRCSRTNITSSWLDFQCESCALPKDPFLFLRLSVMPIRLKCKMCVGIFTQIHSVRGVLRIFLKCAWCRNYLQVAAGYLQLRRISFVHLQESPTDGKTPRQKKTSRLSWVKSLSPPQQIISKTTTMRWHLCPTA